MRGRLGINLPTGLRKHSDHYRFVGVALLYAYVNHEALEGGSGGKLEQVEISTV